MADCARTANDDYTHLNSLQLVGGDIVASFRNCNQVLRIDRSAGTGAVEWQVGGSSPARSSSTQYLEITGDTDGDNEFCRQHHATLTGGALLLFDNGVGCRGPRKTSREFSRVVEYDISSGTQAVFQRQYHLPSGHGHVESMGAVAVLENGNWLISWGQHKGETVAQRQVVSVSEVDPTAGSVVFAMNMYATDLGLAARSYRAYRERAAYLDLRPKLP